MTKHFLTNGTQYVIFDMAGKRITEDINLATRFQNITKATNVLKTLRQEYKKYNFKAEPIDKQNNLRINDDLKEFMATLDIEETINDLSDIIIKLENRRSYLHNLVSPLDLELTDIEHAAEFFKLNAAQGYKLYKMLHDVRSKRREVKNEVQKIDYILSGKLLSSSINQINKSIKEMEKSKYNARVLK